MNQPTIQSQVAAAMAHAHDPASIGCSNCRAMYLREETPFPAEGDYCDECEPVMWDEIAALDAGVARWGEL